ncbi:hypothetical protein BKA66DRAFT_564637 [Pyrenochaeta sp. MPI-SDFR-AT-0127]|nr:hypothetical protein BKA66DRAFT_564637 [Pyrenochaeta sp. MPI-SDFR-AT-0127]
MPPSTRIPPLLQPYIHLPQNDSLLLLTSTLGASASWLLIRFLCDALSNSPQDSEEEGHNVVLVSWMREHEFWKQECRKSAGLDLEKLTREGRFAFVDGLGGLCCEDIAEQDAGAESKSPTTGLNTRRATSIPTTRTPQTLSVRGPPGRIVPARGPPVPIAAAMTTPLVEVAGTNKATQEHTTLKSLNLGDLKSTISRVVSALSLKASTPSTTTQRKTLLILDNPDLFLALNPTIDHAALTSLILEFHNLPTVSHILTHVQSDDPLLSLSTPPQPLELEHHNFLVKYAHMSRRILGVRVLDTGVARDVSGVIRVTEQRTGWLGLGFGDEKEHGQGDEGKEFLYQVKSDGSVKVFERGAGGEG